MFANIPHSENCQTTFRRVFEVFEHAVDDDEETISSSEPKGQANLQPRKRRAQEDESTDRVQDFRRVRLMCTMRSPSNIATESDLLRNESESSLSRVGPDKDSSIKESETSLSNEGSERISSDTPDFAATAVPITHAARQALASSKFDTLSKSSYSDQSTAAKTSKRSSLKTSNHTGSPVDTPSKNPIAAPDVSHQDNMSTVINNNDRNTRRYASGGRPLLVGWWTCCRCTSMVNPALDLGRCGICGHFGPCGTCKRH